MPANDIPQLVRSIEQIVAEMGAAPDAWAMGNVGPRVEAIRRWRQVAREALDGIDALAALQSPPPREAELSEGVQILARAGRKLDAIRLLRHERGDNLKDAKDAVEHFIDIDRIRQIAVSLPRVADAALWPLVRDYQGAHAACLRHGLALDAESASAFQRLKMADNALFAYRPPSAPATETQP